MPTITRTALPSQMGTKLFFVKERNDLDNDILDKEVARFAQNDNKNDDNDDLDDMRRGIFLKRNLSLCEFTSLLNPIRL